MEQQRSERKLDRPLLFFRPLPLPRGVGGLGFVGARSGVPLP
jgi:hypothetical protein